MNIALGRSTTRHLSLGLAALLLSACASQAPGQLPEDFALVTAEQYARAMAGFSSPQAAIDSARVRGGSSDPMGPMIEVVSPPLDQLLQDPIVLDVRWTARDAEAPAKPAVNLKSFKIKYVMGNENGDLTSDLRLLCKFLPKKDCRLDQSGLVVTALPMTAKELKGKGPELRFEIHLADTLGRATVQDFVVKMR